MSTPTSDGLKLEIDQGKMKVGNPIVDANGLPLTGTNVSTVPYVDSSGNLQITPIALPLAAGAVNTANSVLSISGQATGTANDLMHLTLVGGANATAVIAGYYRVTVTDAAGVITSGAYYAPFYTLG